MAFFKINLTVLNKIWKPFVKGNIKTKLIHVKRRLFKKKR
jgi:hypothetical protein